MGLHSKRSASAMERWEACPGSVRMCEGLPSIESEAAKEGTRAHDYAERHLRADLPASEFEKLPPEMKDAISIYASTIIDDQFGEKYPDRDNGCVLHIEHQFDLASVYPECFGTADAVLWNPVTRILRVYDFKYGKGHFVEVVDNVQMQYYGLGAIVTLKYPARIIELVVVQPRCQKKQGPVRRWRMTPMQMLEFESRFVEACERTDDPSAPLVPGRYCFWCPAHKQCPAKTAERLSKAIDSFSEIPTEDDEIDPFS